MRSLDRVRAREDARSLGLLGVSDKQYWRCETEVQKFDGDIFWKIENGVAVPTQHGEVVEPFEVDSRVGNVLTIGGASVQWQTLIGNGTTTADLELTYFSNARAGLGVGDSTTAAADTQVALQAAVNRLYKAMDATYPLHTDSDSAAGAKSIAFRSTFATGDANFAWQEWGVFNSLTHATGRMLNRKVESLGTKTSAATWVLTVTLSLA